MTAILFLLRFLLYSIVGHYIVRLTSKKEELFYGPISPAYGLFGLLAAVTNCTGIIELFLTGIIWGIVIDLFMCSIDRRLSLELHLPLYGLLNILNFTFLEMMINKVLILSSRESIVVLFICGFTLFLADVSISLRKNT